MDLLYVSLELEAKIEMQRKRKGKGREGKLESGRRGKREMFNRYFSFPDSISFASLILLLVRARLEQVQL